VNEMNVRGQNGEARSLGLWMAGMPRCVPRWYVSCISMMPVTFGARLQVGVETV